MSARPARLDLEDLFDELSEELRDRERERQARVGLAALDRVDRLARDAEPSGELRLRPVLLGAQDAKTVLHEGR